MSQSVPRCWMEAEAALSDSRIRSVYAWGPPGCGKTYAAYNAGGGRADDSFAVTLSEETTGIELRGHYLPKGSEAIWHNGVFALAIKNNTRLVINEPSNASDDVLALLMPLMEDTATARMTLPTGDVLECGNGFHIVLTDNRPPEMLFPALRDRVWATIHINEPHPDAMALVHEDLRETARKAVMSEEEDGQSGLRAWIHATELAPTYGLDTALRWTFGEEKGAMFYRAVRLNGGAWDPKPSDARFVEGA